MTPALDEQHRKRALTEFLEAREQEGYHVETRTDTHAIIGPPLKRRTFLELIRKPKSPGRQVVSVDSNGRVSMRPAEPVRF